MSAINDKTIKISRVFTRDGVDPFEEVEWQERTVAIKDEQGQTIFTQTVNAPKSWSDQAVRVVASKYFYGDEEKGSDPRAEGREHGIDQLIRRVSSTFAHWGLMDGYFDAENAEVFEAELRWLLLNQHGAFNSPVWFNVGLSQMYGIKGAENGWVWDNESGQAILCQDALLNPQCSACFIVSVEDDMRSILERVKTEGMLFKYGSGVGADNSKLRSSKEKISGGGRPSGPMSFMRIYDSTAGSIKSGGRCLAADQPVYTASGCQTAKDLADSNKDFTVVSFSKRLGRYSAKTARAWKSGVKEVVVVETDKGIFRVSVDHPFMLKTGEPRKAGDLIPGMSLMACSAWTTDGYTCIGLHDKMEGKLHLHKMVAIDVCGLNIKGKVVHHGKLGKIYNEPCNLTLISGQSEHASFHGNENVANNTCVFKNKKFPKHGEVNGMHHSSDFWNDEEKVQSYKNTQAMLMVESGRAGKMQSEAVKSKMLNVGYRLINAGYDISDFESYYKARKVVVGKIGNSKAQLIEKFTNQFGSYDEFYNELRQGNHMVVSVRSIGEMEVYSVEVDDPEPDDKRRWSEHNYVIAPIGSTGPVMSGVAVFNSRRAAKMETLKVWHPDLMEFIDAKPNEDRKARALVAAGYSGGLNGEAASTVCFQNSNFSVRATDLFMRLAEDRSPEHWKFQQVTDGAELDSGLTASEILDRISEATHLCGDPGLQYEDTIQEWHTCPNTAPIHSSNPCCFVYETLVKTSEGKIPIGKLAEMGQRGDQLPYAFAFDRDSNLPVLKKITNAWIAGETQNLVEVTTDKGLVFRCTPEHRFLTHDGQYVEAKNLKRWQRLRKINTPPNKNRSNRGMINHRATPSRPSGTEILARWMWEQINGSIPTKMDVHHKNEDPADDRYSNFELKEEAIHHREHAIGTKNNNSISCEDRMLVEVWEAIESTPKRCYKNSPLVKPGRWNNYILKNGLKGKVPLAKPVPGPGCIRGLSWEEFGEWIQTRRSLVNDSVVSVQTITLDSPVPVYDVEVEDSHNFAICTQDSFHGVVVSNSEYMHIDDSACNLASLNLMKFRREDGTFDTTRYRAACRIFIIAQDICVDRASYPTKKIAENAHDFRQLGLGFCGLGALIMANGLPYDSFEGRSLAGAVMAIMHGEANLTSAENACLKGPFSGFAVNREPMLVVMNKHRKHANKALNEYMNEGELEETTDLWREASDIWNDVIMEGDLSGFRNSQCTVLAPTGCATPDTLVLTNKGLRRLGGLGDRQGQQWQDADFLVQTNEGPKQATKFYINGVADVISATTQRGYRFRATPKHKIRVVSHDGSWIWKSMSELVCGDIVPLQIGGMMGDPISVPLPVLPRLDPRATNFSTPESMTIQLAELVGAFMANGSSHKKGIRISVCKRDKDLILRTVNLFSDVFGFSATIEHSHRGEGCVSVQVNSTPLCRWWKDAGFNKISPKDGHSGKGYKAHVPDSILNTNDPLVYAAFIRGVIDHDGTVSEGCPEFQNTSLDFISDLKLMAMALGFPTQLRSSVCGISKNLLWRSRLVNYSYNSRWMELIGFTEERKSSIVAQPIDSGRKDVVVIPNSVLDRVCYYDHPDRRTAIVCLSRTRGISRSMAERLYRETQDKELLYYMQFFYDTINSASLQEMPMPTYDLSVPENTTWIGGGFVSHNTIAFQMDSGDSTGMEPGIALVSYKTLAGGGMLTVTNRTVPIALAKLGYEPESIGKICNHIEKWGTIEDIDCSHPEDASGYIVSSGLNSSHLPIFDCAFPPSATSDESGGQYKPLEVRSIHWRGHVSMMGALQPFISGAISKTVNLPNDCTPSDIREAYIEAWKQGVKAVAVFRDGSKESQPVTTSKSPAAPTPTEAKVATTEDVKNVYAEGLDVGIKLGESKALATSPRRERLPDTRNAVAHKMSVNGVEAYIHVGEFPDGRPGELFITMAKEGSTLGGLMDAFATAVSLLFQYGVPVEVIVRKFTGGHFEPYGFTRNPEIPIAQSLIDYIARWIGNRYLAGYLQSNGPLREESIINVVVPEEPMHPEPQKTISITTSHGKLCTECGGIMTQTGRCWSCTNCGTPSGGCG